MPTAFLLDGLLISCKPHMSAVLVCVEYSLVLHNQYVLFLTGGKCRRDVLKCIVFI